jgi:hypothetical protein
MQIRDDLKVGDTLGVRDHIGWESDKGVPGQYHTHIELSETFRIGEDGYSRAADNSVGKSLTTPDPTPYFNGWADQTEPWPNYNPPTGSRASHDKIAKEVIRGNWGNGQERKDRLAAAGYDYNSVQSRVNQLLR